MTLLYPSKKLIPLKKIPSGDKQEKEGKRKIKRQSGIVYVCVYRVQMVSFTLSIYTGQQGCKEGSRGQRQPYLHVWPLRVSSALTSLRMERENVLKLQINDAVDFLSAVRPVTTCWGYIYISFTAPVTKMDLDFTEECLVCRSPKPHNS